MLEAGIRTMTPKKSSGHLVEDAIEVLVQEETDKLVNKTTYFAEAGWPKPPPSMKSIRSLNHKTRSVAEGVQRDIVIVVAEARFPPSMGHSKQITSSSSHPAFHVSKPSDLIPELQGRFPIRGSSK